MSCTVYALERILLGVMVEVRHHPEFATQYKKLAELTETYDWYGQLFGEISALLHALEDFGHGIEGHDPSDASHPILSSKYHTYALRRTPATNYTPNAFDPPIIRIPYVWFDVVGGGEIAVVMLVGDKTDSGNDWYPPKVLKIDNQMIPEWESRNPKHKARVRR